MEKFDCDKPIDINGYSYPKTDLLLQWLSSHSSGLNGYGLYVFCFTVWPRTIKATIIQISCWWLLMIYILDSDSIINQNWNI